MTEKIFLCFAVFHWCFTTAVLELSKKDGISGPSSNAPNRMVLASQASTPRMNKSQFYC